METIRKKLAPYALVFLRFGIGFVFLLFAIHKLAVPEQGRVEVQGILDFIGVGAAAAINYYLGVAELLIAVTFFLGWQMRWFALLGVVLVSGFFASITLKFGLTNDPNLYRDVGLAAGCLALWLLGPGPLSVEARHAEQPTTQNPQPTT